MREMVYAELVKALTVTAASTAGFAQTVQDTLDASQPQPPLNYGSYSTAFTTGPVLLVVCLRVGGMKPTTFL